MRLNEKGKKVMDAGAPPSLAAVRLALCVKQGLKVSLGDSSSLTVPWRLS
jgi:hypothetical protein